MPTGHSHSKGTPAGDAERAILTRRKADAAAVPAQDVGLSKILINESTLMTTFQGTFEWAPPELINGGECSEKADIYSFGVILWEICTAERPFRKQFRPPRRAALFLSNRCLHACLLLSTFLNSFLLGAQRAEQPFGKHMIYGAGMGCSIQCNNAISQVGMRHRVLLTVTPGLLRWEESAGVTHVHACMHALCAGCRRSAQWRSAASSGSASAQTQTAGQAARRRSMCCSSRPRWRGPHRAAAPTSQHMPGAAPADASPSLHLQFPGGGQFLLLCWHL